MRKWSISDGFDVGESNRLGLRGGFLVMHEYYINRLGIDACFKCVRFVIKSENNKNSNLELVEIVKYNVELELTGKMLFLTFKAKDDEGREDVYQAKVFSPETDGEEGDEMKVVIFRKKPSEYQQSKGAEKKHGRGKKRCGCGKKKGGCSCDDASSVIEQFAPPLSRMSVVNPSCDIVFQEGPSSPAPSKTEENPFPLSDAVSKEEEADSPAMRKSRRKKLLDEMFSSKKMKEFLRPLGISDGFDAGPYKPLGLVGAPLVIRELKTKSWRIDACFKCLDFAIKSENNDKKSNLEFVQLVKYSMQFEPWGETYSITFKAKEKEGGEDVYQAKVFNPKKDGEEGYEMKVVIFRKKASEYQQISKDVEEKNGRGKKKEGCSCDGGSNNVSS